MSAEEFIYSVISADNVAQLDLNVIANTLASTDSLIRQIKGQQVENEGLKEKISSLRTSALQIKQLYEAEVGKNQGTVNREADYIRQLKELESRALVAENAKVNAELREKETVAELERRLEESNQKYDSLVLDMVKNCNLLADNALLPSDQQVKLRDWKAHVHNLIQNGHDVPEDVLACLVKRKSSRRKLKSICEYRDQSTMTSHTASCSVGVNTNLEMFNTFAKESQTNSSKFSITNDTSPERKKSSNTLSKTYCDKSTMYSSSTVTRSTCTSAFIKKVDVGVNFPEVVPKSIDDIFRECVIQLPSMLSPILEEVSVLKESVQTQTDPILETIVNRPQMVTCGTNTNLRNIRRKLDYVRKLESITGSQLLSHIKKEESISPANSIQNLPALFHQTEESGVNPQLSQIWKLLGDTMFRLLGTGRMFDSQSCTTINERLEMINTLIDPVCHREETEIMSEAFAAAAASAALVSSESEPSLVKSIADTAAVEPAEKHAAAGKCVGDYEEDVDRSDESDAGPEGFGLSERMEIPINSNEVPEAIQEVSAMNTSCDHSVVTSAESCSTNLEEVNCRGKELQYINEPVLSLGSSETKETSTIAMSPVELPVHAFITPSSPEPASSIAEQPMEASDNYTAPKHPIKTVNPVDDSCTTNLPLLDEYDEIAKELRIMEEGVFLPSIVNPSSSNDVSKKHYIDVVDADYSTGAATDDEGDSMTIIENSPSRLSASSSCTSIGSNGTLISPIKVKETNELVKDQFKTPTSPAISKRKLRERYESNLSKRGRYSPTTESLLEDDWDNKFSRIKDYFALPLTLNPIEGNSTETPAESAQLLCPIPKILEEAIDEEMDSENLAQVEEKTVPTLTDSPQSPVEDSASSHWDDFKVPLQISICDTPPPTHTASASESPQSPEPNLNIPMTGDSPMSPIPESGLDSPYGSEHSPMSPPLCSRVSIYSENVEPKIIPLEHAIANRISHEYINSPIAKTISKYSNTRRGDVLRKLSEHCSKDGSLVRRLTSVIIAYLKKEWTEDNVHASCAEILNITQDTKEISLAVLDCVISCGDLVLDVQCSPPAPQLPKTTQQVVHLIKTLNSSLFTLDRVILQEIDRKIFTLKADKVSIESIAAATYLYIGLADCNRLYGCTARLYIYKCLYYFNFKGLPLIYYVLRAFPHALPKKGSIHYDNSDAMVSTIRTILMNLNYMERSNSVDAHLYKKNELHKLLKFFYGYQQGSPTYEELITNLVEKIKANKLKNVDYCLILVAKRKGYDWAKTNIVQKYLYPLLNDYLKQIDPRGSFDDRISCLIFAISAILKTQPNFQDVSGIMQILGGVLQMTDGNQRVQEAAVAGLLRFTRFGYADIYECLCKWCPKYDVSSRVKLMLATFIHRKEKRFWQQLNKREIV